MAIFFEDLLADTLSAYKNVLQFLEIPYDGRVVFSGTPREVREVLKQAAGISVPKATFVMRVLGVYLLVLERMAHV